MEREFAVYKGDSFQFIGTISELAARMGVTEETVKFYNTPSYKRRIEKRQAQNPIVLVDLGIEEETE